jgi:excisionase family DNA binding protein
MQPHDLLTIPEVAEIFRTTRQSVARWCVRGRLRKIKLPGGRIRIPRAECDRLMAQFHDAGVERLLQ